MLLQKNPKHFIKYPVLMLEPSKKKILFIFKAWKKPRSLEEGDVSSVNQKNKFIISITILKDKVAILDELMGDQNNLKRGVMVGQNSRIKT